ncbi:MAG: Hsp20/alpha crystallin family protein [Anaerolineae bacterium]|nr:Hsp20/alpha crystallin family protein [Anaerolineae bacterium]
MSKEIEVKKKQEIAPAEGQERARDRSLFVPLADIYETDDSVYVAADMPGVNENSVDITLDKNVLTIRGEVDAVAPQGYRPVYLEYGVGDYERKFVLSNEIDREKIEASVKDGVLSLKLPKVGPAIARKITVKKG